MIDDVPLNSAFLVFFFILVFTNLHFATESPDNYNKGICLFALFICFVCCFNCVEIKVITECCLISAAVVINL